MAVLVIVVGGWLFWRWPQMTREIAAISALAQPHRPIPALADAAEGMRRELVRSTAPPQLALAGRYVVMDTDIGQATLPDHRPAVMTAVRRPDVAPADIMGTTVVATLPASPQVPIVNALLAEKAYRLLASGQRRSAAHKFREALAANPDDPRALAWASQLQLMERRWSGSAYIFARQSGLGTAAVEPVLGGGQSGAQLAYAVDPLARRPVSFIARGSTANSDSRTAQLAFGVKWQLLSGLSVAAERLVPVGPDSRSARNLRLAGGTYSETAGPSGPSMEVSTYAEAGAVGARRQNLYAAGTARIGRRILLGTSGAVVPGLAIWGSVQTADRTVARLEVGPSLQVRVNRPVALSLTGEYRQVLTGNSRPASGPALTIAASF